MLVVAVVLALASTGCVFATSTLPACAEAVLDDWTRGALDATYSPDCYEAAIDALPEDLRAYTSAADDISRAAISAGRESDSIAADGSTSRRELSSASGRDGSLRAVPPAVALAGALVVALAAGGLAASLIRRRR